MICLILAFAATGCGAVDVADFSYATEQRAHAFQVVNYGAVGDGVTDNGPAINSAVKAAMRAGGGTVEFPCGEFALLAPVGKAPASRSVLYIEGAKSIVLRGQGHCSHLFTRLNQKSVIEFENSSNISVISLRISGPNAPYVETYGMDGGSAIRFTHVSQGSITHTEIDGASAGAIYLTDGTSNVSVTSNFVHDTYGSAVWEDDCGAASATSCAPSSPPSGNVYESNTFTNTALDMLAALSLDDGNGISNAIIRNNTISWNRQPIPNASNPGGPHCIQVNNASGANVLKNTCTGTPWDAIAVTTGSGGQINGVSISGNIIRNTGTGPSGGSGIVVYDAPQGLGISNFTIESNSIATVSTHGISLYAASKHGNIQKATLESNTIEMADQLHPGSSFGIDVEYSASITTVSNNISCNGKCIAAGININASTASAPALSDNTVTNILGQPLVVH